MRLVLSALFGLMLLSASCRESSHTNLLKGEGEAQASYTPEAVEAVIEAVRQLEPGIASMPFEVKRGPTSTPLFRTEQRSDGTHLVGEHFDLMLSKIAAGHPVRSTDLGSKSKSLDSLRTSLKSKTELQQMTGAQRKVYVSLVGLKSALLVFDGQAWISPEGRDTVVLVVGQNGKASGMIWQNDGDPMACISGTVDLAKCRDFMENLALQIGEIQVDQLSEAPPQSTGIPKRRQLGLPTPVTR
jgi:hypothetical protein